jgi:hypothetical protein
MMNLRHLESTERPVYIAAVDPVDILKGNYRIAGRLSSDEIVNFARYVPLEEWSESVAMLNDAEDEREGGREYSIFMVDWPDHLTSVFCLRGAFRTVPNNVLIDAYNHAAISVQRLLEPNHE